MALYRFLFAPVLLVVAVLTTSSRPPAPPRARTEAAPVTRATTAPAHVPVRGARVNASHDSGTGR